MIECMAAVFTMNLLQTRIRLPRFHIYLQIMAHMSGLLTCAAPFIPYAIGIKVNIAIGFLGVFIMVSTGLVSWKNGFEVAKYFSLAWFAFLSG